MFGLRRRGALYTELADVFAVRGFQGSPRSPPVLGLGGFLRLASAEPARLVSELKRPSPRAPFGGEVVVRAEVVVLQRPPISPVVVLAARLRLVDVVGWRSAARA